MLGGIAVYGASIMLIAQMYHMEGNPPDASSCGRSAPCWPPCWCGPTRRSPRPSCSWSCGPAGSAGWPGRALGFLIRLGRSRRRGRLARLAAGPASGRDEPGGMAGAARLLHLRSSRRTGSWSLIGVAVAVAAAAAGPAIDRHRPRFGRALRLWPDRGLRRPLHPAVHRPADALRDAAGHALDPASRAARHPDAGHAARRHAVGARRRQPRRALARLCRLRARDLHALPQDLRHAAQHLAVLPRRRRASSACWPGPPTSCISARSPAGAAA